MSFALARYEPVAFHRHPDLMRAADAQTAVLHPAAPVSAPVPMSQPVQTPPAPASSPARVPVAKPGPGSPPTPAPSTPAPSEPIAAYVVGMDATPLLRTHLADFLDAAGSRRDVRVSVGVAAGGDVAWVLRDQVPYGVRAMPCYPVSVPTGAADGALAAVAEAAVADAADAPARRQLVILLWDRPPEPVMLPASLRSALVVHCVDAVLTPPALNGSGGSSWMLARSRPGSRPSLLAHAGTLLDRWESFAAVPPGLAVFPLAIHRG